MKRDNTVDKIFHFFSRIRFTSNGCWEWTGSRNREGYGQYSDHHRLGKKLINSHRWAYIVLNGEPPTGTNLDHLCRNRACANPSHLEPVSVATNILRGVGPCAENKRKTHCNRGHSLTGKNLVIDKHCSRICRQCGRDRARDFRRIKYAIPVEKLRGPRTKLDV